MTPLQEAISKAFKSAPKQQEKAYSEKEYPTETKWSPRGNRIREFDGRVINQGGKRKVVLKEPKPYQPLKHDTESGYGEKRKRYVR